MKMIGNVSDWLSYAGGALIKVADSAGSTVHVVWACFHYYNEILTDTWLFDETHRVQTRQEIKGEVKSSPQENLEVWNEFPVCLYILYIFTSPSAENKEKFVHLGRLFLPSHPIG